MCKQRHNGPCWRDNLWAGPLPAWMESDEAAVKAIKAGRAANAKRLGERCVPLINSKDEEVNVLIEEVEDEQWPVEVDREEDCKEEDCPLCPSSPKDEGASNVPMVTSDHARQDRATSAGCARVVGTIW